MGWEVLEFWKPYFGLWNEYRWLAILGIVILSLLVVGIYLFLRKQKITNQVNCQNNKVQNGSYPIRPFSGLNDKTCYQKTTDNSTHNPTKNILSFSHCINIIRRLATKCKENLTMNIPHSLTPSPNSNI